MSQELVYYHVEPNEVYWIYSWPLMPLIWIMVMGWVGIQVGKSMVGIVDDSISPARSAGEGGAALGKKAAGLFRKRKRI